MSSTPIESSSEIEEIFEALLDNDLDNKKYMDVIEAKAAIGALITKRAIEELKNVDGWMTSEWAQPIGEFRYPNAHQLLADRISELEGKK